MDLLCPRCRVPVALVDGDLARCPTPHGANFRILYRRPTPVVAPAPVAADGSMSVGDLLAQPGHPGAATPAASEPPAPPPPAAHLVGMKCVQHTDVDATAQCARCGAFSCVTCTFIVGGGRQLCPACATAPRGELSPRRKRAMLGSYALAAVGSAGLAAVFLGAFAGMNMVAAGLLFTVVVLAPSVLGFGWGMCAVEKRLSTPGALWGAVGWNGLIIAAFLTLIVAGLLGG